MTMITSLLVMWNICTCRYDCIIHVHVGMIVLYRYMYVIYMYMYLSVYMYVSVSMYYACTMYCVPCISELQRKPFLFPSAAFRSETSHRLVFAEGMRNKRMTESIVHCTLY